MQENEHGVWKSLEYGEVYSIQESGICRNLILEYGVVWRMQESEVWSNLQNPRFLSMQELEPGA